MKSRQSRTNPFLLFVMSQLAAGGITVLAWPLFFQIAHARAVDQLAGPAILFTGILSFAIFLLLAKKDGFLRLAGLEQISARTVTLVALSFLATALVGVTMEDAIMYVLRGRIGSPGGSKFYSMICVFVPLLVLDLNLLAGGRLASIIESLSARFSRAGEWMRGTVPRSLMRAVVYLSRPWSASLIWTILFIGIFFSVFRIGYTVDDDIAMVSILSGYLGGSPSPFLVHGNVLVGLLMSFLYGLHNGQNWFILFLILSNFLSTWALTGLIYAQPVKPGWKVLGAVMVVLCSVYFLINITFTITASYACLAGLGLLIFAARPAAQNDKRRYAIYGCLLILLGSLIRFEAALQMALIIVPVVLITSHSFHHRTLLLSLVFSGALVVAGYTFDRFYVGKDVEWNHFYLYNNTLALLKDTPRLTNLEGTYPQVGWSSNDLNSFANWFFPDPELYSLANLRYLIEHTPQDRGSLPDALGFLSGRTFSLVSAPYLFILVALWIWMVISGVSARKVLLPSFLLASTTLGTNVYLAVDLKIPNRVILPSFAACTLIGLVYFISSVPVRSGNLPPRSDLGRLPWLGLNSLALSLLLAAGLVLGQTVLTSRANIQRQSTYHQAVADLDLLREQGVILPGALIVSPAYGLPLAWSDPLRMEFPPIQYLDMGWLTFSPSYEAVLRDFDIPSLASGLYEKENVYVMTTPSLLENVRQFILEHEDVEVDADILYEMPAAAAGTAYEQAALYKLVIKK